MLPDVSSGVCLQTGWCNIGAWLEITFLRRHVYILQALVNQLMNVQSILKVINTCGAELSDIAPGDASLRVDDSINIANKRFSNVRERIEKLSEKSSMMRQRALEVQWLAVCQFSPLLGLLLNVRRPVVYCDMICCFLLSGLVLTVMRPSFYHCMARCLL